MGFQLNCASRRLQAQVVGNFFSLGMLLHADVALAFFRSCSYSHACKDIWRPNTVKLLQLVFHWIFRDQKWDVLLSWELSRQVYTELLLHCKASSSNFPFVSASLVKLFTGGLVLFCFTLFCRSVNHSISSTWSGSTSNWGFLVIRAFFALSLLLSEISSACGRYLHWLSL